MNRRSMLAGLFGGTIFKPNAPQQPLSVVTDIRLAEVNADPYSGIHLQKQVTDCRTGETRWEDVLIEEFEK